MASLTDEQREQFEKDGVMYKRTYDAYTAAYRLSSAVGKCKVAPVRFGDLARSILLLDEAYQQWIDDFAAQNNLSDIYAHAVVEAIADRLYGSDAHRGSSGEAAIQKYLEYEKIQFVREQRFEGLMHIGSLRFDFFLPEHNAVIEFNGLQHYQPVEWFGGDDGYRDTVMRDNIKKHWCKTSKIKLFEIKYNENLNAAMRDIVDGLRRS